MTLTTNDNGKEIVYTNVDIICFFDTYVEISFHDKTETLKIDIISINEITQ